jgi:tRNA nucleotidyltransferase/poly(A) polymerase
MLFNIYVIRKEIIMFKSVDIAAKTLLKEGYEVYVVGGAVRDMYMNRKSHDIDLATNATPQNMIDLFTINELPVIDIGAEFGTVAVILNGEQVEITTYRKDIKTDGRKVEVEFADSIEEDLARRDFTINSLAINYESGNLLNLYGGIVDIESRVVKAIGDPHARFLEDHLRMLRACRFTAIDLLMTIEPNTKDAIIDLSSYIHTAKGGKVTTERQREELLKGMSYPFPSNMIDAMKNTGLLFQILPELHATIGVLQNKHHTIYKHKVTGEFYVKGKDGKFVTLL